MEAIFASGAMRAPSLCCDPRRQRHRPDRPARQAASGSWPGFLFVLAQAASGAAPSPCAPLLSNAARIRTLPPCRGLSFPTNESAVSTLKTHDTQALDALTGGAFSAPTSGERAARVRDWLQSEPNAEQMQEVFRELSARDKGAARLLREKLDEIKRAKGQEVIAAEWAEKARGLLSQPRLNIADAMAWQRDAAKAGAPLSREPLAGVKAQLADRVKGIEDLQHRVQVQR